MASPLLTPATSLPVQTPAGTTYSSPFVYPIPANKEREKENVESFSILQVCSWLKETGFDREVTAAFEKHHISGSCLRSLTHALLAEMGIQKVGTQKRILILIQQHTAPPLSSLHQLFRIEPRSSSNNLNQTIHHSKNASLDRIRANGKSLSPNIAPRSSSKSVTTLDRQYGIYPNELTMADTIPNVQGRIPLPMHQPSSSSASSIGEYGSNHPPWKPYASLNNDGSMAGIGKLVARPTGSHTMPAPVTGAAKQQFSQQTQFVGPMTRRGSGPNLLAPSGLQVSTTESPSSSERVIIKVQDGNQEVHRIDVTAVLTDGAAIRKLIFKKFHIAEELQRSYALFYSAGSSKEINGATTSTISDEDLARLCSASRPSTTPSPDGVQLELILRKTFTYPKRSLESNLSNQNLIPSPVRETSNMMFAIPPVSATPAPSGQQQQSAPQQQQAAAASAALAKSLRSFGLLGTEGSQQASSVSQQPPTIFSTSTNYFDPPPRSKKSLSGGYGWDNSASTALNQFQQQQQKPINTQQQQALLQQQQQQTRANLKLGRGTSGIGGAGSSSKRSSVKSNNRGERESGNSRRGSKNTNVGLLAVATARGSTAGGPGRGEDFMNLRRGSKFKSFFAERPRDEMIADKLKKYFPELAEEEEVGMSSTGGNASGEESGSGNGRNGWSFTGGSLIRPRIESKPVKGAAAPGLPTGMGIASSKFITSSGVQIPARSRSIKIKVEEAVKENRRKSVLSTIVVKRRLSAAASALLKEVADEESPLSATSSSGGGIQKRRGVSSVRIGTGVKAPSSLTSRVEEEEEPAKSPTTPEVSTTLNISPGATNGSAPNSYMSDGLSVPTASQTTIVAPPSNDISILSAKPVVAEDIKSLAPIVNWTQGKMIGQGAFGKVFHALNLDTGEFMAVKQVLLGPSSGANNAASEANKKKQSDALERELDMLKDLEHENIVRYLGFELKDGSLNLFLQYVSGGSIASLLSKTGKLDLIVARYFTFQILCGMAYLHSKNIIHRDIKGGNILVDADGICKISDFGTSKKNAYQMAYQRVTRMSMQGTIPWMAPEVAKGKGYSAKVDIWSVGCMVLEMLTGVPPWHKVSASVIYLLGTGNSPPVPDDLSPIAKDFLKTCFVIDPDKRPTALELVDHEFCRLSSADSESFEFQAWVLAAEERHAAEIGDAMEEEEDSSDYTDSDEDDSDSDEEEEDDETTSHEELESDDHSEIEEAAMSE